MEILNYADDKNIVKNAMFLLDIYQQVKNDRKQRESIWDSYYNMWRVYVDYRYYSGTSNIYLPVIRKATEDGVNNITTKLFPTDDFICVIPMPGTPERYADGVKMLLVFQMLEDMAIPLHIKTSLRELLIYGTTVNKIGFDGVKRCPYFEPLSIKDDFYIYPTTTASIDDAMVTFERIRVDRYELEKMAKIKKYINIEKLNETGSTEKDKPRKDAYNDEHREYKELPVYDLVETYATIKIKNENVPVIITFAPEERQIIQITPSPYKFKTPNNEDVYFRPYVAHSLIRRPKEFYGNSIYEVGQRLQYALNDSANLVLDNGILQQTPIVKMDRARVGNVASIVFKPRAIWDCEPDAVIMDRPPDVLGSGLAMVSQLKFWLEEQANVGGLVPMTSKRVTATEISIYNQLMGTFISSTVADIETGLTLPLAKKVFYLDQIYLDNKDIQRILGVNARYVQLGKEGRRIVKKDYMFRWLGATQSMNIYVKSQQAINFIGMTASIPPQALAPAKINYPYLLKEAWRNLGHTDVDRVIIEENKTAEMDAREENQIILAGKEVQVSVRDDDLTHILAHNLISDEAKEDEAIFTLLTQHINEHIEQMKNKNQLQQLMAQGIPPILMQPQNEMPNRPQQAPITTQANDISQVLENTMGGIAKRPYTRPTKEGIVE